MSSLDSLSIIQALSDAVAILETSKRATVNSPAPIFLKSAHAVDYLNRQISAELAPHPERDPEWCYVCDRPKNDCGCVENGGTY